MQAKPRLVRANGTVVEPIDIRISVSAEQMKTGKKWDWHHCPLAEAIKRYFGPYTTAMVDWERITIWPHSKSAVVTCATPHRLKRWMEEFDTSTRVEELPKPLQAQFTAQLLYSRADRAKVEEWCARWEQAA